MSDAHRELGYSGGCQICGSSLHPSQHCAEVMDEQRKDNAKLRQQLEGVGVASHQWHDKYREAQRLIDQLRQQLEQTERQLTDVLALATSAQIARDVAQKETEVASSRNGVHWFQLLDERDIARKESAALAQQLEQVTRERDEAHGRGVSSGKQEALRYTPEERKSYGKHVEAAEQYATLRQHVADLESALKQIATDSAVSSLQSNPALNPRHIARAALTRIPDAQSGATPPTLPHNPHNESLGIR